MRIVFVRHIHEHEACRPLRVIVSKDTNVEAGDGFPDEHDGPVIPLRARSSANSLATRRAVRGEGPGSL
jgi:hypothetical protein